MKMTPRHILSRWERVAPMLTAQQLKGTVAIKSTNAWLGMLYLADTGIFSASSLASVMACSRQLAHSILVWMHRNNLAERKDGVGNSPDQYTATARLYEVLALKPTPKLEGAAS